MSEEGVDIVRQAWKAYRERGIDGVLDYYAEDCILEEFPETPDRRIYEGKEGVWERNDRWAEVWGDFVIEPVEFIDAGENVVVTVTSMRGRGKGSGAPVEAPIAIVHEIRDGKVVRDRNFTSRSEALRAAGLRE